jgi:hypothetical protein
LQDRKTARNQPVAKLKFACFGGKSEALQKARLNTQQIASKLVRPAVELHRPDRVGPAKTALSNAKNV